MSTITLERPESVEELVDNALPPKVWKDHLENDLMKFWDRPEAYTLDGGLFPTYRTNAGEKLSANKSEWTEEFKAAYADPDTNGLVEPEFNFVRAHSRNQSFCGIYCNDGN